MHALEATGDIRKVSLWLGHQSIRSTEIYLQADPVEKLLTGLIYELFAASGVHREKVAACPRLAPRSSTTFHTVARSTRKRRPVRDMRTPR